LVKCKKQTQSNPIQTQNKPNAKNQHNPIQNKDIYRKTALRPTKNKPNSNPTPKMSINIYNTKAYIKKLAVRPSQTNPNKPNFRIHRLLNKVAARNSRKQVDTCLLLDKRREEPRNTYRTQSIKEAKMSWNLFERIINAFRPQNQAEDQPQQPDQWPQSDDQQPWQEQSSESSPENSSEQTEASREPSPAFQQATASAGQDDSSQQQNSKPWQQD
jgi:hypothetical protein